MSTSVWMRAARHSLIGLVVAGLLLTGLQVIPAADRLPGLRPARAEADPVAPNCTYPGPGPVPTTPATKRLSTGPAGAQSNGDSLEVSLSSDGRSAAYSSAGSNIVGGDTNGTFDIFSTDPNNDESKRVSVNTAGAQATGNSFAPSVSGDGQKVAFHSYAPNLLGGDGDTASTFSGGSSVVLPADSIAGSTATSFEAWFNTTTGGPILGYANKPYPQTPTEYIPAVSVGTDGKLRGLFWWGSDYLTSAAPVNDGRWHHVVLTTYAGYYQYLYVDGVLQGWTSGTINHLSMYYPVVGQAFGTGWAGMNAGWQSFNGRIDEVAVYRKYIAPDRVTAHYNGRTTGYAAAVLADAPWAWWRMGDKANGPKYGPYLYAVDSSGNQRHGVHVGTQVEQNGALTVDTNDYVDVLVRDQGLLGLGATTANASIGVNGAQANGTSAWPDMSADGQSVLFLSNATNLVATDSAPGNIDTHLDLFVRNLAASMTKRITVAPDGTSKANSFSQVGSLSRDGKWAAFSSAASNLVAGDQANTTYDVFLRDVEANTTTKVSVGTGGAAANSDSFMPDISADGRYIAYYSWASNLIAGDTNAAADVFVYDRLANSTTKVSTVQSSGAQVNGSTWYPRMSDDGRYVTFFSNATNLVAGDSNNAVDLVVADRANGGMTLVSAKPDGTAGGTGTGEYFPAISGDGRRIVYSSTAPDLVSGDTNGRRDAFRFDYASSPGFGQDDSLLPLGLVAESNELGLEQFYPYSKTSLGTGTAYTQLRTGNLVAQFDDQTVPGQGLNTVIRHTYNSRRTGLGSDAGMGPGWNLSVSDLDGGLDLAGVAGDLAGAVGNLDVTAALRVLTTTVGQVTGQVVEFTDTDGTTHRFVRRGPPCSRWESPPGVNLKLREVLHPTLHTPQAYELVRPDGVVYRAEPQGLSWRIVSITDRRGNRLSYSYNLFGKLQEIKHNRPLPGGAPDGHVVARFEWKLLGLGPLEKITTLPGYRAVDPATGLERLWERKTIFGYDIDLPLLGRLTTVTQNADPPPGSDAATRVTRFGYEPVLTGLLSPVTGGLTSVTDGENKVTAFTYEPAGQRRVTTVKDRGNNNWNLTYGVPDPSSGEQVTTLTAAPTPAAPQGATTEHRISKRSDSNPSGQVAGGNIVAITDAGNDSGRVTSRYEWSKNRLVATSTDGIDNRRTTSYNDLGLVTKVTEPKPNDPARPDLPAGAPQELIENRLDYHFPPQFRYPLTGTTPEGCERPVEADPPPPVSNEGWCFAVAELTRTTFGSNQGEAARVTDFASDPSNGSLTSVTQRRNPNGSPVDEDRTTSFGYYAYGGLKTVDGPRTDVADIVTYGDTADPSYGGYDRNGSPRQILDAVGKTKRVDYTPYGLPAWVRDRDGQETRNTYDEQDKLVRTLDPRGDTSKYTYDGNDQRITETSPATKVTTTKYNNTGSVTKVTSPGGVTAMTSYNADGTKATTTSPAGGVTDYKYWPNQALRSMEAPTSAGQVKALTEYSYDSANRLRRILSPITTDAGGRPEETATYTPSGAIATQSKTSPLGDEKALTRFAYNAHGEQIEAKGPRNVSGNDARIVQAYDAFGAVTTSDKYLSATESIRSSMGYDKAGNQTSTTLPTGAPGTGDDLTTNYRFDALNQLAAQTNDPVNSGHSVDYTYSGEGQQLSRIDKVNGTAARTTTFAFNPDNTRRSQVSIDHGAGTYLATCNWAGADPAGGYDPDGNLVDTRTVTGTWTAGMTDVGACGGTTQRVLSMGYDNRNFMTSATQTVRSPHTGANVVRAQSFAWANDAQWTAATHDGRTTGYAYDPSGSGRRTTITDWRNRATSATYQPSGAPRTQSVGGVANQSIGYLADGSMSSMAWNRSSDNASVRAHTAMAYDVGGLRLGETVSVIQPTGSSASTGGPATFSYDLLDRLKSWKTPFDGGTTTYTLDEGGNITTEAGPSGTVTSTYESGRLKTRNGATFSYNGLGEETTRTDGSSRTYDPAGHTASEKDPDKPKVDYVYDSTDRLIARTEGVTTDAKNTTLYFYWGSGGAVAEETDGAGATKVRYLVDEDQEAVAQESYATAGTDTPAWAWLLVDEVGNVATLLDDAGVVTEVKAFDPYGKKDDKGSAIKEPAPGEPPAKPATLGFQGHITDPTTASVVLGARLYDPTAARFTTPDTFVAGALDMQLGTDALTGNRYLFAAANPVAFFDDGHWPSMPKALKNLAKKALPAIAFVPVVGTAVEAVSVATGRDWLDGGRKMSGEERALRGGLLVAEIAVTVATAGAGSAATGAARKAAVKGLGTVTDKTVEATAKQGAKGLGKEGAGEGAEKAVVRGDGIFSPGSHAGKSVPARGPQRDFTKAERDDINTIGKDTGCHRCGSLEPGTKAGNFIPDHQPPNAIARPGWKQRLFPHCRTCSNIQGGTISQYLRRMRIGR